MDWIFFNFKYLLCVVFLTLLGCGEFNNFNFGNQDFYNDGRHVHVEDIYHCNNGDIEACLNKADIFKQNDLSEDALEIYGLLCDDGVQEACEQEELLLP